MNAEKAKLKIDVASDIGGRVEDAKEAARLDMARHEGGVAAFLQVAKAIEGLSAHVDRDIDEGKYGIEVGAVVKRYLERCANASRNLSGQAENARIAAVGRVSAFDAAIKMVANYRAEEQRKIAEAEKEGAALPLLSDVGARPAGLTIKEQRLAEARAEKDAPKPEPTEPATPEAKRRKGRVARAANS